MARLKYSGIITNVKGKIGGMVFQDHRAGSSVRKFTKQINRATQPMNDIQNITFKLQNEWKGATNSQRKVWSNFVKFSTLFNKHEPNKYINGQQAFIKLNSYRLLYGHSILWDPDHTKCIIDKIVMTVGIDFPQLTLDLDRAPMPADEFIILA